MFNLKADWYEISRQGRDDVQGVQERRGQDLSNVGKRLGVIWDRYEKEQWGDIEFEDPCPVKEYERFI